MTILHLSDTHGLHQQLGALPAADVIVHSGDFTMAGTEQEVFDFLNWFLDLPYAEKIVVAGNHDDCLLGAGIEGLDANCHYLCNSGITINGVRFYGVPAFIEMSIDGCLTKAVRDIPNDTQILVTRQPPLGILDFADNIHYGSSDLLKRVQETKPQFHLFGHIHDAYGQTTDKGTLFSNASVVDENYKLTNKPVLLHL